MANKLVSDEISTLAKNYGKTIDAGALKFYLEAMKDFTYDEVERACRKWGAREDWMPKPAQLAKSCKELNKWIAEQQGPSSEERLCSYYDRQESVYSREKCTRQITTDEYAHSIHSERRALCNWHTTYCRAQREPNSQSAMLVNDLMRWAQEDANDPTARSLRFLKILGFDPTAPENEGLGGSRVARELASQKYMPRVAVK